MRIGDGAIVDRCLALLRAKLPDDVAAAVRRSLRDLGPLGDSPVEAITRERMQGAVLAHAVRLRPEAVAAVVDAGYLPEDDQELLPLLFLTEQFEWYDREDPDGTRLGAVLAGKWYRYERRHFRAVAERAGRPDPWPFRQPSPSPSGDRTSAWHGTTWPSSFGTGTYGGHGCGSYSCGGHSCGGHF